MRNLSNSVGKTSSVEFAFCGRIFTFQVKISVWRNESSSFQLQHFHRLLGSKSKPFGFYFSMNSFIEILTVPKPCPNITGWRRGLEIHPFSCRPLISEPLTWGQEAMSTLRIWWPLSPELQWLCALFYKIGLLFAFRKFVISPVIILTYSNISMCFLLQLRVCIRFQLFFWLSAF